MVSDVNVVLPISYTLNITAKVYHKNRFHQMPDLTAKLHQIQCLMGLCPRPHWRSSQQTT